MCNVKYKFLVSDLRANTYLDEKNNYNLYTNREEFKNYDLVLICIPYLQARELSKDYISFSNNHIPEYDPIYTLMLSFKVNTNIKH